MGKVINEFFSPCSKKAPNVIKSSGNSTEIEKPRKKIQFTPIVMSNTRNSTRYKMEILIKKLSRLLDSKFTLFKEEMKQFLEENETQEKEISDFQKGIHLMNLIFYTPTIN